MNRFLRFNRLWMGMMGLALLLIFLAFLFRPASPGYQAGAGATLRLMNDPSRLAVIAEIPGKQLIDIRTSSLFLQGHPDHAVNLPMRQLLSNESVKLLDHLTENGKEVILYGTDELQATAPWLLLQQLGYRNIKILRGGYTGNNEFIATPPASAENPSYDPTMLRVQPSVVQTAIPVPVKRGETVVPSRKPVSAGGGC